MGVKHINTGYSAK